MVGLMAAVVALDITPKVLEAKVLLYSLTLWLMLQHQPAISFYYSEDKNGTLKIS
jgi:hypothetical protein